MNNYRRRHRAYDIALLLAAHQSVTVGALIFSEAELFLWNWCTFIFQIVQWNGLKGQIWQTAAYLTLVDPCYIITVLNFPLCICSYKLGTIMTWVWCCRYGVSPAITASLFPLVTMFFLAWESLQYPSKPTWIRFFSKKGSYFFLPIQCMSPFDSILELWREHGGGMFHKAQVMEEVWCWSWF